MPWETQVSPHSCLVLAQMNYFGGVSTMLGNGDVWYKYTHPSI